MSHDRDYTSMTEPPIRLREAVRVKNAALLPIHIEKDVPSPVPTYLWPPDMRGL